MEPPPASPSSFVCGHCHTALKLVVTPRQPVISGACPTCGHWLEISLNTLVPPESASVEAVEPAGAKGRKIRFQRSGKAVHQPLKDLINAGPEVDGWEAAPVLAGDTPRDPMAHEIPSFSARRWLIPLGVLGAGMLLAGSVYLWLKPPVLREVPGATALPGQAEKAAEAAAAQELQATYEVSARKTLAEFIAASSAEEKLRCVLTPPAESAALEAFYKGQDRNDQYLGGLKFDPQTMLPADVGRGLFLLIHRPAGEGDPPLLLFFRNVAVPGKGVPPRLLLDWETYVQQREKSAESFMADPLSPPRVLRLLVERAHIFGDQPADRKPPMGLKWRALSGTRLPVTAEVDAGSPLHEQLMEELEWGKPRTATFELAWDRTNPAAPRLTATRLVCWEFLNLGGTARPQPAIHAKTPKP